MSSSFGDYVRVSIFGESHSEAIGMVLDGLKPGIKIDMDRLDAFMERRRSKGEEFETKRKEKDEFEFLSGIKDDFTIGTPISGIIYNRDYKRKDYKELEMVPRPGHSDYPAMVKYGKFGDYSGGGHFSGRLTAPICLAGGIILQYLETKGITIETHILEIGGAKDYEDILLEAKKQKNSLGGIVSCKVKGMPIGYGSALYGGIEGILSQSLFAIPGIKGVEFGSGFSGAKLKGSENNDEYYFDEKKNIKIRGNNHGGILGGLSTGNDIDIKIAIKPISSIGKSQNTVSLKEKKNVKIEVKGRHDVTIVKRVLPAIEAAVAIGIINISGIKEL